MVKTVSKLFTNDKNSTYGKDLKRYISDTLTAPNDELGQQKSMLYHRFVGNRFHIYFLDAGLVFHYTTTMITFFETVKELTNPLAKAIYDWLKSEKLVNTLRGVGLVGKFITGPWMRFIPSLGCILDLNPHLHEAMEKLSRWIEDPSPLLEGTATPVFPTSCLKDGVFDTLTKSQGAALDQECCELLKSQRQMCDQLPGGRFWNPSPDLYKEAQSCRQHQWRA
jgi:hypothetical protein